MNSELRDYTAMPEQMKQLKYRNEYLEKVTSEQAARIDSLVIEFQSNMQKARCKFDEYETLIAKKDKKHKKQQKKNRKLINRLLEENLSIKSELYDLQKQSQIKPILKIFKNPQNIS